jgi:replicative superfamily II helicase
VWLCFHTHTAARVKAWTRNKPDKKIAKKIKLEHGNVKEIMETMKMSRRQRKEEEVATTRMEEKREAYEVLMREQEG